MVAYKEFRVGELFKIEKTKSCNTNKLTPVFDVEYPYVTRTSLNNGVNDYTGKIEGVVVNEANVFSLGLLGMDFFHQKKEWYAGQFVRKVIPKFNMSDRLALYFKAHLDKQKEELLKVLVRNVDSTFENEMVFKLPTTSQGTPDFDFMENYIKEIEQKHIAKVKLDLDLRTESLLTMIGREDLIGDPDGLAEVVAAGFVSTGVDYAEFRVGDLFDMVSKTSKVKGFSKADEIDDTHTLPATSSTTINNMIGYYVDPLEHNALRDCLTITANGINTGFVTYQPSDFGISQDSYALFIKPSNYGAYPPSIYYYMMSVLSKVLVDYDYNKKAGWTRVSEETIKIPVTPSGKPDFNLMAQYIAYIELKYTHTDAMDESERIGVMEELIAG